MSENHLPWRRPSNWDDRPCISDERQSLTYLEFGQRVEAAAEQFAEHGVGPDSVVAVMLPNQVELLIALTAAWRLGASATPINPTFTANEADYQIDDANSVVVVNTGPDAPAGSATPIAVGDLRTEPNGTASEPIEHDPGRLALLIYTSGSTGRPKGVRLSHHNLTSMATMLAEHLDITGDDHCLLVLPLFHVNAICVSYLTPVMLGGRLSMLARFNPVGFLDEVAKLRPTYFSAVPTIYSHLLAVPEDTPVDTSSVRFAICGAAPASKEMLEAVVERFGFPLLEGYGLTEGTCASTANPVNGVNKPGTVGIALPGQTVATIKPDGTMCEPGERGEVVIKGDNVMEGYHQREEATASTIIDGWLHTGDVGIIDEDGYLRIVDRIKDMIIRGGENLYPKEIENVLYTHPAVMEAAVVGQPHDAYGEVPVAFVATFPETTVTEDELRALCAEQLTKVKVPVTFHLRDELAKNPIGKLDKPTMRAEAAAVTAPV